MIPKVSKSRNMWQVYSMYLKVIRSDTRIMLIPTLILCLSLRLIIHISKNLDK